MQEYTIFSGQNRRGEIKPLDCECEYNTPFVEGSGLIYLDPDAKDKRVIGGEFIKTRVIIERPLPKVRFYHTKKYLQKRQERVRENHSRVEALMKVQGMMLQIHDRIVGIMRQISVAGEDDPDTQREKLRAEIARLDIPGILKTNNLDVSSAQGETRFAFAGFQMGFAGRGVYGTKIVEDEKGDFFLDIADIS